MCQRAIGLHCPQVETSQASVEASYNEWYQPNARSSPRPGVTAVRLDSLEDVKSFLLCLRILCARQLNHTTYLTNVRCTLQTPGVPRVLSLSHDNTPLPTRPALNNPSLSKQNQTFNRQIVNSEKKNCSKLF